jgi:hypothetical protein
MQLGHIYFQELFNLDVKLEKKFYIIIIINNTSIQ